MTTCVSEAQLDPDFVKARDAIETLHSRLQQASGSLGEAMTRLEEIYREAAEEVSYEIITEVIELEYIGARWLLVEALQTDSSALVRHEAAFGLGVLGDTSHIQLLTQALLNDENLMVRHEAAIALAAIGGEESLGALMEATQDELPEVAESARYAIQEIRLKVLRDRE